MWQVPRRAKHLILYELRYLLFIYISLLRAILIRSITDLVCVRDVHNTLLSQHRLPINRTLILANLLWGDQVLERLVADLLGAGADLVSVDFDWKFFDKLLEHLVCQIGEEVLDLPEIQFVIVFFQKSYDVSLWVVFDVGLVVTRLWVEHWFDGLDLANWVHILNFPQYDFLTLVLILEHRAEEVRVWQSMEEDRCLIQLITQYSNPVEHRFIYIPK